MELLSKGVTYNRHFLGGRGGGVHFPRNSIATSIEFFLKLSTGEHVTEFTQPPLLEKKRFAIRIRNRMSALDVIEKLIAN